MQTQQCTNLSKSPLITLNTIWQKQEKCKTDFIFSSRLHLKPLARDMGQGEFLCTVKHNATKEKPTWRRADTS